MKPFHLAKLLVWRGSLIKAESQQPNSSFSVQKIAIRRHQSPPTWAGKVAIKTPATVSKVQHFVAMMFQFLFTTAGLGLTQCAEKRHCDRVHDGVITSWRTVKGDQSSLQRGVYRNASPDDWRHATLNLSLHWIWRKRDSPRTPSVCTRPKWQRWVVDNRPTLTYRDKSTPKYRYCPSRIAGPYQHFQSSF